MILSHDFSPPPRTGGPVVAFLHAFPLDRSMWRDQWEGLRGDAGMLLADCRGYGGSAAPAGGEFSFAAFADDLRDTLDSLRVGAAVLAGCSMGGYTAFEFWRRHPGRVVGMVLCNTRAEADTDAIRARRAEQAGRIRDEGTAFLADWAAENLLSAATRDARPRLAEVVRETVRRATPESVVATLGALAGRADSTPTLATIRVPVAVVVGDGDTVTPPSLAETIASGIAGSRLTVIPGAGHLSPLESPEAVNDAVRALLARV
jgi:pimeloyl-ACP methyl ester carboxylesterase